MKWRRDIDAWFIAEVLPHAAAFRAYARRLAPGADEAEDLVQEAYARALAAADFRAVQCGKAYVFRILHNVAVTRARRARIIAIEHIPNVDALNPIDPSPDPHAHAVARQELARLEAAIRLLPDQCRRVVTLRKVYDLSPGAIAAELNISVSTVEKHLTKGIRLLAEALAEAPPGPEPRRAEWAKTRSEPS